MLKSRNVIRGVIIFSTLWCEERKDENIYFQDNFKYNTSAKIGDNPFPTNPISDRAIGYLLQGKAQSAISNYGNIPDLDKIKIFFLNKFTVKMRSGGISNRSIKNILLKMREDLKIMKKFKFNVVKTILIKNFSKIKQFFI